MLSKKIYEDFSLYTRYGGAVGKTRSERPDYKKLGVEFKTMELGGRLREYMIYVPQLARAAQKEERMYLWYSLCTALI
jgi:hypothetical protein